MNRFVTSILKAINGEKGIIEEAYLYLPGILGGKEIATELGVDYFAVPVEFGKEGAIKAYPIGSLSAHEEGLLKAAVEELKGMWVKAFNLWHIEMTVGLPLRRILRL